MKKVGELVVVARAHALGDQYVGEYGLWRPSIYGGAYRPTLVEKIDPRPDQQAAIAAALEAGIQRAKGVLGDSTLKAEPFDERLLGRALATLGLHGHASKEPEPA